MKKSLVLLIPFLLTACATSPDWQHANIVKPSIEERQLKVDHGICTQVSAGAVPMPEVPDSPTGMRTYSGSFNSYNANSGSTYGTFSGSSSSGGFASGLASGMSQGFAIGAAMKAKEQREAVYTSCMLRLGWSDESER